MTIKVKDYHTEHGHKTVLVDDRGHKWLIVLIMNGQLAAIKVPKTEERYMTEPPGNKLSLRKAISEFRAYGKRLSMTKAAKAFLATASKSIKETS